MDGPRLLPAGGANQVRRPGRSGSGTPLASAGIPGHHKGQFVGPRVPWFGLETAMNVPCRNCNAELRHSFVDLGPSPLANSYVEPDRVLEAEPFYPLHAYVCDNCFLVQLRRCPSAESIFTDSTRTSPPTRTRVLAHARDYADDDDGAVRLAAATGGRDGEQRRLPAAVLHGARHAGAGRRAGGEHRRGGDRQAGIPTRVEFFGVETAQALAAEGNRADLMSATTCSRTCRT